MTSPACSLLAAELAGEKYGLDSAFVDALHGVADDYAISLLKSESILGNLLGAFVGISNYGVKLARAEQCTVRFVNYHYGPIEKWESRVGFLRNEPERELSSCKSLVTRISSARKDVIAEEQKTIDLQSKIDQIEIRMRSMQRQSTPIKFCG